MKTTDLFLFHVLLVLVLLGGCTTSKYVPKANEELYGTWTNEFASVRKVVYTPGEEKLYYHTSDTTPMAQGTLEVVSKWTDSQHNVWYKALYTGISGMGKGVLLQVLIQISNSGSVLESIFHGVQNPDPNNYPTTIDRNSTNYNVFNRSQS